LISQFNFDQASFVFNAKTFVIEAIMKQNSMEVFMDEVVQVEQRLNLNLITEIRQLELELICAGKVSMIPHIHDP
jgi:hypothetical protein